MQTHMPRINTRLTIEPLGEELLVYCPSTQKASCLNPTARWVLERCDGRRSLSEVAAQLSDTHGMELLSFTLGLLSQQGLVDDWDGHVKTRRQFLSLTGKAALLLPTIASVLAPTPAAAASVNCTASSGSDCASLLATSPSVKGGRRFSGCGEGCTNGGADPGCSTNRCATFYCADPNSSGDCTSDELTNPNNVSTPYCGGVFSSGSIVADCAQGRSAAVSTFFNQKSIFPNQDIGSFNCPVAESVSVNATTTIFRRMFEYICCDCPA